MISITDPKSQLLEIQQEITAAFEHVLSSGNYILGENVSQLEEEIAEKLGVTECITVANGTDALVLSLRAYGINEGDEVITTPFSFFATAEAITRVGAKVVFADVDKSTFNLAPSQVAKKITDATKAILPVHLFGQPACMEEINTIARENELIVIEDACQAFGATYQGKSVGNLGDIACFSFFPTKNLSTLGDGGMITTSDQAIAKEIRKLRAHGSQKKYFHEMIGYNSRLDEVHAAIIRVCLQYIDEWNEKRRRLTERYDQKLKNVKAIKTPVALAHNRHVYHLYCLASSYRKEIIDYLAKNDIQTGIYYPRCIHLQTAYLHLGHRLGDFPIAENLSETLFAIPLYPNLSFEDQDKVIKALHNVEEYLQ